MEPAGGAGSAQRGAQCLGIAVDLRSLLRREGWHQGCGTEGLGFCGTGRVPPQTGRFLCVCFSQEQRNLPGLFLASFLVLSSPFSLQSPRPFPCPFLAPSLCKPQNFKGFRERLQSFGFTPAALSRLVPVPTLRWPSGLGGRWDSEGFTPGTEEVEISPPDSPEIIKVFKKNSSRGSAGPSQDKAAVLMFPFPSQKDPNPSQNTPWARRARGFAALFGFGVLVFPRLGFFRPRWHVWNEGNRFALSPELLGEAEGSLLPLALPKFPPQETKHPSFLFLLNPRGFAAAEGEKKKTHPTIIPKASFNLGIAVRSPHHTKPRRGAGGFSLQWKTWSATTALRRSPTSCRRT